MSAWNGWYHIEGHTYGTWLRGDPRGWRARYHREHIEGDYRNPPSPGTYDKILQHSKNLMKQPPVYLNKTQRRIVGQCVVEMLSMQDVQVLALSMDAVHLHVLAKFLDSNVRPIVGRAKKHAYHTLHGQGGPPSLWATRHYVKPIADREHQVRSYEYILDHAQEDAWVWYYTQGIYWKT